MQYVPITSAWIQFFIFQRNNGACSSLIVSTDKPNPFPFVGHRNTRADIIVLSHLYNWQPHFINRAGDANSISIRARVKMMAFFSSVDLKCFASCMETLLTVFAAEGLGLHCILISLSFQGALGVYLMRPREYKNMICNEIYFPRRRKHNVALSDFSVMTRCNIDPPLSSFGFMVLQQLSAEHKSELSPPSIHAEMAKRHLKFSKYERDLV